MVNNSNWLGRADWAWRIAAQHGDLNARNVLLSPEESTNTADSVRIIDFEKWTDSSPVLDVCWLSCCLLMHAAPTVPNLEMWDALPGAFVDSIVEPQNGADQDFGHFQLALGLARILVGGCHATATDGLDANTLRNMLALTLAAVALAHSFYETRGLEHAVAGGTGLDATRYRQLWALFFFRAAAIAFGKINRTLPVSASASVTDNVAQIFDARTDAASR